MMTTMLQLSNQRSPVSAAWGKLIGASGTPPLFHIDIYSLIHSVSLFAIPIASFLAPAHSPLAPNHHGPLQCCRFRW